MVRSGSNLPDFRAAQLAFAAHIRNPEVNPPPADVEPRRMKIYLDLFYNNIESFLAGGFPVAKKVLGQDCWHRLVREFVHRHPSESPYFLEISQEFLTYLSARAEGRFGAEEDLPAGSLPPFLLELTHYEWVELALSVSDTEHPEEGFDPEGDLLDAVPIVSPLIWCLSYRWPVHQIGPGHIPTLPPANPTDLIVYRRRDDAVRFMAINPGTQRLLALLGTGNTGRRALAEVARELPELDSKVVYEQGLATLQRLREAGIILGSRPDVGA